MSAGELIVRDGKGGKDRVTVVPATAGCSPAAPSGDAPRSGSSSERRRGRARRVAAAGAGPEVPAGDSPVGLAVPVSVGRACAGTRYSGQPVRHHLYDQTMQRAVKAAVQQGRHPAARQLPHLPPLLRHPSARRRLRHPHGAGAARPQRREDHDDLHPRDGEGGERGEESAGSGLGDAVCLEPADLDECGREEGGGTARRPSTCTGCAVSMASSMSASTSSDDAPTDTQPGKVGNVGAKAFLTFLDDYEVLHRWSSFFRPACLSTLFKVPGVTSEPVFPDTVTVPRLTGCWY